MRILAIETSSPTFSVALMDDVACVSEIHGSSIKTIEPGSGSSSQLVPAIKTLLKQARWQLSDLNGIAISIGPGSFTGLRVGIVAAKSLAYALKIPVVAINTLHVLAFQAIECSEEMAPGEIIRAVTNAQRKQVFSLRFVLNESRQAQPIDELTIVDNQDWVQDIQPGDYLTGSGIRTVFSELTQDPKLKVVDSEFWQPNATSAGKLALPRFRANDVDDLWTLNPLYFRPSAAEEKRQKSR